MISKKINFDQLTKLINANQNIYIFRHINPDGDCVGSQYALEEIILSNFKNKNVKLIGKQLVTQSYLSDLFDFTKQKSRIEKIKRDEKSLVIVVDSSTPTRVDCYDEIKKLTNAEIVKLDHHPYIETFDHWHIINESYSSTCELIADYLFEAKNFKIPKKSLFYLYVGILTDTGRFLHSNVTEKTFKIMSQIKKYNIDFEKIHMILYENKTLKFLKYQSIVLSKVRIYKELVSFFICDEKFLKKSKCSYEEVSNLVNLITGIKDIRYTLYAVFNKAENNYKISLRSTGIQINKLAEKFGGGGHKYAAGLKFKDVLEIKNFLKEFVSFIRENEKSKPSH